jgi:hypothetical protein
MSFRTWLYVFAIIGLTLPANYALAQSASENEPRQEERAADAQQDNQEEQQPTIDLTTALNDIESAIRDLIEEEDKIAIDAQESREKRGLNAQEAMAEWAKLMFFATFSTVLLTFVALVYIRWTLIETKNAVRAADKTVLATREIGQKQVRAYLSVSDVKMEWGNENRTLTRISFIVENTGSSPARDVSTYSSVSVIDPSAMLNDKIVVQAIRAESNFNPSGVIPSSGTRKTFHENPVTDHDIVNWKLRRIEILGFVHIKYNDVFGDPQHVEYCTRLIPNENATHHITDFEIFAPLNTAS